MGFWSDFWDGAVDKPKKQQESSEDINQTPEIETDPGPSKIELIQGYIKDLRELISIDNYLRTSLFEALSDEDREILRVRLKKYYADAGDLKDDINTMKLALSEGRPKSEFFYVEFSVGDDRFWGGPDYGYVTWIQNIISKYFRGNEIVRVWLLKKEVQWNHCYNTISPEKHYLWFDFNSDLHASPADVSFSLIKDRDGDTPSYELTYLKEDASRWTQAEIIIAVLKIREDTKAAEKTKEVTDSALKDIDDWLIKVLRKETEETILTLKYDINYLKLENVKTSINEVSNEKLFIYDLLEDHEVKIIISLYKLDFLSQKDEKSTVENSSFNGFISKRLTDNQIELLGKLM